MFQLTDLLLRELASDSAEISLRKMMAGMNQQIAERSVIGHQQEAGRIKIKCSAGNRLSLQN